MPSSCAPPTQCDVLMCHVTCSHPPQAWDSHHVVDVCQEVQFIQFVGEAVLVLRFLCYLFDIFVTISIQHCLSLGNAAHPPTVPKNPHASCTQANKDTEIYAHPPASFPPSAIHTIHTNPAKPPTHSNPTHPLIPPSFFRFLLGRFNHQKQLRDIHSTRYRCFF